LVGNLTISGRPSSLPSPAITKHARLLGDPDPRDPPRVLSGAPVAGGLSLHLAAPACAGRQHRSRPPPRRARSLLEPASPGGQDMSLLPRLELHLALHHMHGGGTGYAPLTRTAPGTDGGEPGPQGRSLEEAEDATTMVLVCLRIPELIDRASCVERLHRPADLEAIFGAAGLLITHGGKVSFRVVPCCTPYDRGGNYFFSVFARIANTSSIKAWRLSGGRSLG
jgi:hypothetical protein